MDAAKVIKDVTAKMEKAVAHTLHEFSTLHTGKASPSMVENVVVDAYGSSMKVKEVAAITTPDSRTINVQPWDKGLLDPVCKAIQLANIGINPTVFGPSVRCPVPELSRERRQEMVKVAGRMAEDGKVTVRNARRDGIDALKKLQKAGAISEDDLKRHEKEVQVSTDKFVSQITEHFGSKEKELMKV